MPYALRTHSFCVSPRNYPTIVSCTKNVDANYYVLHNGVLNGDEVTPHNAPTCFKQAGVRVVPPWARQRTAAPTSAAGSGLWCQRPPPPPPPSPSPPLQLLVHRHSEKREEEGREDAQLNMPAALTGSQCGGRMTVGAGASTHSTDVVGAPQSRDPRRQLLEEEVEGQHRHRLEEQWDHLQRSGRRDPPPSQQRQEVPKQQSQQQPQLNTFRHLKQDQQQQQQLESSSARARHAGMAQRRPPQAPRANHTRNPGPRTTTPAAVHRSVGQQQARRQSRSAWVVPRHCASSSVIQLCTHRLSLPIRLVRRLYGDGVELPLEVQVT